jgi:endonuclease/exonuclease/phosphatase family metal-dependent hydrolase/glycerophosphoryl diester phosphodiesterase
MKNSLLLPIGLLLSLSLAAQEAPLHVMSFNIRLDVASDGYNAWPHRRALAESMIRFHGADLLGVQEALPGQMEDLRQMLPEFASHGVARDTGPWGEYSALFYRRQRLRLLEGSTFWLSETPDVPSKGWDAALNRIATWAKFEDRLSGKQFLCINTHFDHRGEQARRESARLLLRKIAELNPQGLPLVLLGDFNSHPGSEPYRLLTQAPENERLYDAYHASLLPPHGPEGTWSGFSFPGEPGSRIDYVFFCNEVAVLRYGALSDSWAGRFPSDHLPVLAELLIGGVSALPNAHAHNDYAQERPLFGALSQGFTSIEADVWLIEGELYVYHDRPARPDPARTLRRLYLDPLAERVGRLGAVYPGQEALFQLMIDFKSEGLPTWEKLKGQLADYEWLLKGRPGKAPALRIFISGNSPIAQILAEDSPVGADGRPEHLGQGHPAARMPVISDSYGKQLRWRGEGPMPEEERRRLSELCARAHAEGKQVRLWATPEKEAVWQALRECGVDYLNTDEQARLRAFLLQP